LFDKQLHSIISGCALAIGMGRAEVEEVDRLNIYWAVMEARRRAVEVLTVRPAHILVDGKHRIAGCRISQTAVVDGDVLNASVAAASIVAKVDSGFNHGRVLAALSGIRVRKAQGQWHGSPHQCADTPRSVAASPLVTCASVASEPVKTTARNLARLAAKRQNKVEMKSDPHPQ
jgi:hypothetical protein